MRWAGAFVRLLKRFLDQQLAISTNGKRCTTCLKGELTGTVRKLSSGSAPDPLPSPNNKSGSKIPLANFSQMAGDRQKLSRKRITIFTQVLKLPYLTV